MAQVQNTFAKIIQPGDFEAHHHWYPKALNATIHPMISFFLKMEPQRIISRYCHLHPLVKPEILEEVLSYKSKYFQWAGADLINVTPAGGKKQMVVIENNSCPSGQKSMPLVEDHLEQGSYRLLIERTFKPYLKNLRHKIEGGLAVVYDKNPMETSGYAATIADVFGEDIWFVEFYKDDPDPPVRFVDRVMEVRDEHGEWHPIRAAFRYLTQKPWNRLPINAKTRILNPVVACLAGGRNKMAAAKAYDFYNGELSGTGLSIRTPETIWDVSMNEIPLWVKKMGGQAVVKVPYSNAGQGVYTIVTQEELDNFMELEFEYDRFIVQSLIGNYNWSSMTSKGKLYHVGTIPDAKGNTYVADIRMMISATKEGFKPLCVYARRAEKPLVDHIESSVNSWSMLGTNLSHKDDTGRWATDSSRLVLMDRRDFNRLGLGLDDLIEGYIQTILSTIAIDKMAKTLFNKKGEFRRKLFKNLNDDPGLLDEIML